jgi:hypothetical protein
MTLPLTSFGTYSKGTVPALLKASDATRAVR